MRAVHGEHDGAHGFAGFQENGQFPFEIDAGDELAGAQVVEHLRPGLAGHAERGADAGPAAVQPEHEARPLRRSPMHEGTHAKRAVIAAQPRPDGFRVGEARPPHQRAVAENPKIAHIAKPYPANPQAGRNSRAIKEKA